MSCPVLAQYALMPPLSIKITKFRSAVLNLTLVYFFVGEQRQTSTRPNCVRDFESRKL